ncbi:echinoderm microtubule-associated protein-like 1 isoform X2 [Coregonus clupeaformis]|uniref:echinoderm microtubule-associated protein-like 1 isoform X2 n=1 Tax=Coregonus clupeaformis TaxID=59861 RepID=UPI001BDFD31B|nr:echinoderm microtubule-associated protein-like 1 isoform X2 [Coregonus clupeaformis]
MEEDIVCQTVEERRRRGSSGVEEGSRSMRNLYDNSSLHRVSNDDRSSAASGIDVADRLTYLEQRMQMQDDEIQLLKMALADVLKRLNISEEHQVANAKKGPAEKARPVSLGLPSRTSMNSLASLKKSSTTSTLPSTSTARNYSPLPGASAKSGVKSSAGSVKENPCTSKTARPGPRPGPAGSTAAPGSKKADSKTKEPAASVGLRRVTHCKVTMQIYLSPQTKRTGSSEAAKSAPTVPNSRPTRTPTPPSDQRSPPDLGPDQGRDTQINSFLHPPPAEKHQSKYVFSSGHVQLQKPLQITKPLLPDLLLGNRVGYEDVEVAPNYRSRVRYCFNPHNG